MSLKGKRIFYVEDDIKNRAIVELLVQQQGAIFGFERWGDTDTIPRLKAFAPVDLILLDLMFPKRISGYDIFNVIRQEPEFANVPIVAVSASDPEIEIPRTQAAGFAGFISKPIDLRRFASQLEELISGKLLWIGN